MAIDVTAAASFAAQEQSTNKARTGYDVLTRSLEKTEQMQVHEQQRLEIAEQTGKGLNLDVRA